MDFLLAYLPYASPALKIEMILTLRAYLRAAKRLDDVTARRCDRELARLGALARAA